MGGDNDNKAHRTCRTAGEGLSAKWLLRIEKGGWEEREGIPALLRNPISQFGKLRPLDSNKSSNKLSASFSEYLKIPLAWPVLSG